MALFFTRRTYNASKQKFTDNVASLTRYVRVQASGGGSHSGGIISRDDWLDLVIAGAQSREVLIYVHGFNTDQAGMLSRLGKVEGGLRANGFTGAVVAFDWPSRGDVNFYDSDRTNAKAVAPFLVPDGILAILQRSPGIKVHLLAHSMGAYLTLRAFSGEGQQPGQSPWKVDQALFVAADVEAEALRRGAWGALVMEHRCQRLTNYYNVVDQTLTLAGGIIHGGRERAGRVGLPDLAPANAVDLYTTQQFRNVVPDNQQGGFFVSHNWYYDDAGCLRDIRLTVAGQSDATMPTRVNTTAGNRALLT